jgi:hypothetical protein
MPRLTPEQLDDLRRQVNAVEEQLWYHYLDHLKADVPYEWCDTLLRACRCLLDGKPMSEDALS